MLVVFVVVLLWEICGIITYGATLGYFQREYPGVAPKAVDARFALTMALAGPFGLIVATFASGFFRHGFMWW